LFWYFSLIFLKSMTFAIFVRVTNLSCLKETKCGGTESKLVRQYLKFFSTLNVNVVWLLILYGIVFYIFFIYNLHIICLFLKATLFLLKSTLSYQKLEHLRQILVYHKKARQLINPVTEEKAQLFSELIYLTNSFFQACTFGSLMSGKMIALSIQSQKSHANDHAILNFNQMTGNKFNSKRNTFISKKYRSKVVEIFSKKYRIWKASCSGSFRSTSSVQVGTLKREEYIHYW